MHEAAATGERKTRRHVMRCAQHDEMRWKRRRRIIKETWDSGEMIDIPSCSYLYSADAIQGGLHFIWGVWVVKRTNFENLKLPGWKLSSESSENWAFKFILNRVGSRSTGGLKNSTISSFYCCFSVICWGKNKLDIWNSRKLFFWEINHHFFKLHDGWHFSILSYSLSF